MHRLFGLILLAATLKAAPPPTGSADGDMAGWSRRADAGIAANACAVELPRLPLRQAVTTMLEQGKKTVLIKAEKRIPHEDVARVARAASEGGDVQVYFAVVESSAP